jgi:molybdopterin-guanine dinucleotide biosynthesis protein B
MVPVVSFVGNSGVGKTTFLEKLIPVLKSRGFRLASIKHDVHNFTIDYPGKDSWRLTQAGSDIVVLSAATKLAVLETVQEERSLADLVNMVSDRVDLVITEGYRGAAALKIEVSRAAHGTSLTARLDDLLAVVTDHPIDLDVPQFGLNDVVPMADFLIDRFNVKPSQEMARS